MKSTYRRAVPVRRGPATMSELSCPSKQARAEGPHCRHGQSQHVHPHTQQTRRPTAAAWKPAAWGDCSGHGPWLGRRTADCKTCPPQVPAVTGFLGVRFSFSPYVADSREKQCLPEAQAAGAEKGCCRPGRVAADQKPSERQRQNQQQFCG